MCIYVVTPQNACIIYFLSNISFGCVKKHLRETLAADVTSSYQHPKHMFYRQLFLYTQLFELLVVKHICIYNCVVSFIS